MNSNKNIAILKAFIYQNQFTEFDKLHELKNDRHNSIKYTQSLVKTFYRTETGIKKKSQKFIPC